MPSESKSNLYGERIRKAREHLGLSQNAVATAAGTNRNRVVRIEGGQLPAPERELGDRLAEVLQLDADQLWLAGMRDRVANDEELRDYVDQLLDAENDHARTTAPLVFLADRVTSSTYPEFARDLRDLLSDAGSQIRTDSDGVRRTLLVEQLQPREGAEYVGSSAGHLLGSLVYLLHRRARPERPLVLSRLVLSLLGDDPGAASAVREIVDRAMLIDANLGGPDA